MQKDHRGRPIVRTALMCPGVLSRARDFAHAAQRIRQEAGLTQKDVAARAGVSQSSLSRFETGKGSLDFRSVVRVFTALGCVFRVAPQPEAPEGIDLRALARPSRDRSAAMGSGG
ncbi:MAG TPA: hypothetical protein DEP66_03925 [Acidimicrobiaceae bacterium]|nr:hypothetical protein [Acidimicrobiaceae bacterium]HCB37354.1 hypothetical protein [Acidimicrobiaceae bacterium]